MWKTTRAAFVTALIAGAAGAETLSTLSDADGEVMPWGIDDTAVYGQSITFADDVVLRSFEFRLDDGGSPVDFDVEVYSWTDGAVTGSVWGGSSGQTLGAQGFQDYRVSLGELQLPAGKYVVLIGANSPGTARFATAENAFEAGAWVYLTAVADVAVSSSWFASETADLAFGLEYSSVAPEN